MPAGGALVDAQGGALEDAQDDVFDTAQGDAYAVTMQYGIAYGAITTKYGGHLHATDVTVQPSGAWQFHVPWAAINNPRLAYFGAAVLVADGDVRKSPPTAVTIHDVVRLILLPPLHAGVNVTAGPAAVSPRPMQWDHRGARCPILATDTVVGDVRCFPTGGVELYAPQRPMPWTRQCTTL